MPRRPELLATRLRFMEPRTSQPVHSRHELAQTNPLAGASAQEAPDHPRPGTTTSADLTPGTLRRSTALLPMHAPQSSHRRSTVRQGRPLIHHERIRIQPSAHPRRLLVGSRQSWQSRTRPRTPQLPPATRRQPCPEHEHANRTNITTHHNKIMHAQTDRRQRLLRMAHHATGKTSCAAHTTRTGVMSLPNTGIWRVIHLACNEIACARRSTLLTATTTATLHLR
jgi:hypothetical protein